MKADIQSRIGAENYETMKLWCGVKLSPIQVSPVGTQCLKAQWWTKLLSLNLCYAELSYIILGFWLGLTYCTRTTVKYGWLSNDNWDPWFSTFQTLFWPSIVKNTKSQKHEWMNEWMRHLCGTFTSTTVHPKRFIIMLGSLLKHFSSLWYRLYWIRMMDTISIWNFQIFYLITQFLLNVFIILKLGITRKYIFIIGMTFLFWLILMLAFSYLK